MSITKTLLCTLITITLLHQPLAIHAQGIPGDIRNLYGSIDPNVNNLPETEQEVYEFVPIVYGAMLFVGLITVLIFLLYAGILWITSGGDPKALAAARQTALNAIIGMIILATTYLISLIFQRTVI